ncbi:PfkB family carbohydrate kinase [Guyparkeria hydrothermalis]|uniref:PfkB family carbohydrate kinase n=1 Tax=Guyparkeria hydrothermalis TaxID=923 RepID=UPI002021CC25|nr:PfkB family carbohydrate kinase [Guyparkeria hydrothermalis]MCL7744994.1 PfkB family carbohydrate kinase [Guyparkeria hydrothermalis]
MTNVLGVGIATLDIINELDHYPEEDSEQRACSQRVELGGNVANSLRVLRQFGHPCDFAGVLAEDADGHRIAELMDRYGVDTSHARRVEGHAPTSYITLNRATGSRTIVHHRDLPEFDLGAFMELDPSAYDWLHFEARACDETAAMLALARAQVTDQPISLEVEKDREHLDQLWSFPDVIFFSKAFANGRGFDQPARFLHEARHWAPQAILVLGWGSEGAWLSLPDEDEPAHVPAQPVDTVVDSIAAGDTLIAGFIHARSRGASSRESLEFAARLVERKLAQAGLAGLGPDDPAADPRLLCRLEDLEDVDALGVWPGGRGQGPAPLIVTREGERVCAWRNVCPHNGSPLSRERHDFLEDHEGERQLRCNVHQAYFRLEDGLCTDGPCEGQRLEPVELERIDNRLYLTDR